MHSCHVLILACPSSEPSREGREERTPSPCRAEHHPTAPASSQVPQCCPGWGHSHAQSPDTHVNLAEDDINDAANHYEEVKDIPGVSEVALSGRNQRRVNMQGYKSMRRQTLEPRGRGTKGSPVTLILRGDGGQTLHPLLSYLVLSCNGVK